MSKPLPIHLARLILALGKLREQMPDTWRRLAVELAIYAIWKEYKRRNKQPNPHEGLEGDER